MSFLSEMADMVSDIMRPDQLGQTGIELIREVAGEVDQDQPWLEVTPTRQEVVLLGGARGVDELADGTTILQSDILVVAAIPPISWKLEDGVTLRVRINGVIHTVVQANTKPRAGTPVAIELIVRRGNVKEPLTTAPIPPVDPEP